MSSNPVIGLIVWDDSKDLDPELFLGDSPEQVTAAAARRLWQARDTINGIDDPWLAANPEPDYDDSAAVEAWLDALSYWTTDGMVTVWPAKAAGALGYTDLRR